MNKSLTAEEAKQALKTAALSASQKEATTSTFGLGTAFKGLGVSIKNAATSLKAFAVSNPATAVAIAATAAIAGSIAVYTKLHPSLEKATDDLKNTL